ncbi:MAG TPA: TRAP transporter substrate-binding protein DctP [Burkholderiales bacterium]|nr:TRAP transporter substrate-binding protein DctP [Burkholderiales bacterium]
MNRLLLALTCLVLAAPALGQKTVLRFSTAAPPADFLSRSMQQFKAELEKSAPEFDVQLHYASSLFRQGTEVPAMQRGNLEMSTMTTFEVAQQVPELGFFNRAYLFRDYAHAYKTLSGPVGKRYADLVAQKMDLLILAPTYLGTRQVALRAAREVKAPADLAGLKLRMPGGPDWLLLAQSIGATPTPMGMPEVYVSLQTGTIDGQENPPTIFSAAKFHEVSKQMVLTSHLVQPIFYAVAKPYFDKLKPEQQKKLREAAVRGAKWNDDNRLNDEKTVIDGLAAKGLTVSRPDLAPFRANADKVYASAEAAKAWDRKLMEEAMAVR